MSLSKRDRYIRSALRKIWRWSEERREALKNAQSTMAGKKVFRCAGCGRSKRPHLVVVDHKFCVTSPERGFISWDDHIKRLFCSVSGLQVMCKRCHKIKTQKENKIRRMVRAKCKNSN